MSGTRPSEEAQLLAREREGTLLELLEDAEARFGGILSVRRTALFAVRQAEGLQENVVDDPLLRTGQLDDRGTGWIGD